MKRLAAALIASALITAAPALAKDFVQDQAGMFSSATVQQLNTRIGNFNAQTGKEVIVQTVPSVSGGDVRQAAENAFAQQHVNGVLIFIDKGDRKDWIQPDRALVQSGWWNSQTSHSISSAMEAQFRAGDFDGGITTAVAGTLNVYRSHLGSLRGAQPSTATRGSYAPAQQQGGIHIGVFWWIIIALFAFFIIRSIMRAAAGPRYYGGGGQGYGPGGYGPGYGPGYGYGGFGGGGGFFSGLLGGLGGAWLGNELFGRQNIGTGAWNNTDPTGGQPPADAGGWQSDPGQAGMGGGGGGDWGGGGFGGGGDFGGGFGGGDGGGGGSW